MNDIEQIRKRLQGRKTNRPLNDHMFKRFYNSMIKLMVVLVTGLLLFTYSKSNQLNVLFDDVFSNQWIIQTKVWINEHIYTFDEDIMVSNTVSYQGLGNDLYTNYTNDVTSLDDGRVIYLGSDYVTVLLDNNVQVTYSDLNEVTIELYTKITKDQVIGHCNEEVKMTFEYLGKWIDYDTYQGME